MIENNYIFSRSKAEKNLVNYLDLFAIVFILIFPILIILFGFSLEKAMYVGVFYAIVMIPIIYLYRIYHQTFAYRITFDFNQNVVIFDMLRNKGTISAKASEIDRIAINHFITFFVKDKKIKYKYRDKKGKELTEFIKERLKTKLV
jgi:hypothetical protein